YQGMHRNDEELARGPIFKRRIVADAHLFFNVLWMSIYCLADTKTDNGTGQNWEIELSLAGVFCLGVFASRVMVFAVDFHRFLAIPALLLTVAELVSRVYLLGITIVYETIDLSERNSYNLAYGGLFFVVAGQLWVIFEYARSYNLIKYEKVAAREDEECRVESDAAWKEKQKIRKRHLRKKQREDRKAELEKKARENGDDTPSTSTDQPSTSHDHYYIEKD
ncbi:hypothetical protein PFISCL1PPCAC_28101, partial [Pristionchus fissidentatus]